MYTSNRFQLSDSIKISMIKNSPLLLPSIEPHCVKPASNNDKYPAELKISIQNQYPGEVETFQNYRTLVPLHIILRRHHSTTVSLEQLELNGNMLTDIFTLIIFFV